MSSHDCRAISKVAVIRSYVRALSVEILWLKSFVVLPYQNWWCVNYTIAFLMRVSTALGTMTQSLPMQVHGTQLILQHIRLVRIEHLSSSLLSIQYSSRPKQAAHAKIDWRPHETRPLNQNSPSNRGGWRLKNFRLCVLSGVPNISWLGDWFIESIAFSLILRLPRC